MASKPTRNRNAQAACELRSASLTLVSLQLRSLDAAAIAAELGAKVPAGLFDAEPAVLDLSALEADATGLQALDASQLGALMRAQGLTLVAVRGTDAQADWARAAGLPFVSVGAAALGVERETAAAAPTAAWADAPSAPVAPAPSPAPDAPSPVSTATPLETPPRAAMVVDRPLRSGQQVYARGTDLIVMAAVNFGAEVIADGHIHVYAPLRGRAIAGARGDANARIFASAMEPQLISIAGTYRTLESDLPTNVRGKPAQVRLEGDRLLIEPIGD